MEHWITYFCDPEILEPLINMLNFTIKEVTDSQFQDAFLGERGNFLLPLLLTSFKSWPPNGNKKVTKCNYQQSLF